MKPDQTSSVASGSGGPKIENAKGGGEHGVIGDRDEDTRFDRLLARSKAVQGEMNEHSEHTSHEHALLAKHHQADNSSFRTHLNHLGALRMIFLCGFTLGESH